MKRLLAAMLMLCAAAGALAAAPAHVEEHVANARLAGKGPFTWFGLRIYDAELWVGDKGAQALAPYVLELRYARKLDGAKIADASVDEMEKLDAGTPAQRAAWLVRMKALFPNVQEGTRISGVNLPGAGVRFYLDGKPLGMIDDPAFAKAFFAIWLDPRSTGKTLRTALLKDAAPK